MQIVNPFFTTSNIPAEFFCDRKQESEELIREVTNGNHLLLMSPRRLGKTGLVNHCFASKPLSNNYNTFCIDIYDTSSLQELCFKMGKEVFEKTKGKSSKFLETLKSLRGEFTYDPVTMSPKFAFSFGQIHNPEHTLDEILEYLEHLRKPCLVAIDEFQQIAEYEEKNVEALLRSKIQRLTNTHFIFSGSERHLLGQMFHSPAQPFYRSAGTLVLKPIERNTYVHFAEDLFSRYDKRIDPESITGLYNLMEGYTYFMQRTLNELFSATEKRALVGTTELNATLNHILDAESVGFSTILAQLTKGQRAVLAAIAMEGHVKNALSQDFLARNRLGAVSSVQAALRSLLKKQLISRTEGTYYIDDKFLELWIRRSYGKSLEESWRERNTGE